MSEFCLLHNKRNPCPVCVTTAEPPIYYNDGQPAAQREPPADLHKPTPQVVGRVHKDVGHCVAYLNSVGLQLSDGAPLYATPQEHQPPADVDVAGLIHEVRTFAGYPDKHGYVPLSQGFVDRIADALTAQAAEITALKARVEQEVAFSIELNARIGEDAKRIAELEVQLADERSNAANKEGK